MHNALDVCRTATPSHAAEYRAERGDGQEGCIANLKSPALFCDGRKRWTTCDTLRPSRLSLPRGRLCPTIQNKSPQAPVPRGELWPAAPAFPHRTKKYLVKVSLFCSADANPHSNIAYAAAQSRGTL